MESSTVQYIQYLDWSKSELLGIKATCSIILRLSPVASMPLLASQPLAAHETS